MKVQSFSLQGRRPSNEDEHFYYLNLNNKNKKANPINLVSVFDGHGGKMISKYLKKNLPFYFLKKQRGNIFTDNVKASKFIRNVFNKVQEDLSHNSYYIFFFLSFNGIYYLF